MKDTATTENELLIPEIDIVSQAYDSDEKLTAIIEAIEKDVTAEVYTVETAVGRKRIASQAYKISRSKTAMDKVGAGLIEEANKLVKMINGRRNIVTSRFDALRDKVRKPLTDWEEQDDLRKKAIKERINTLFGLRALPESSAELRAIQDTTIAIELDDSWQEFLEEATKAKDGFLRLLAGKIHDAVRIEEREAQLERERQAQAAELERLREAQAIRDREDALRKEEEERQAAAMAEKDAELAAMKAQLEALQKPAQEPDPVEPVSTPLPSIAAATVPAADESVTTVAAIRGTVPRILVTDEAVAALEDALNEQNEIAAAILAILKQSTSRQASAAEIASAIVAGQIPYVKVTF